MIRDGHSLATFVLRIVQRDGCTVKIDSRQDTLCGRREICYRESNAIASHIHQSMVEPRPLCMSLGHGARSFPGFSRFAKHPLRKYASWGYRCRRWRAMARSETPVVAKSDDVSITPAKYRIKNRKCAMTRIDSRLGCLRFRVVSVTPFLHKSRPWSPSGDATN